MRILISGGGTGGHIYPAIAIADEIKKRNSNAQLLFVGASDKMEMQRVPQAGYKIIGLWISGIQRKITFKNILFPIKLIFSLFKSWLIILKFKPHIVIGTGGFASGPILFASSLMKIPTLIQEQNSYPGITNQLLAKRAKKICVAYDNLNHFFDKNKMVKTGNPIRAQIASFHNYTLKNPHEHFGLDNTKKTILILGGSLGAQAINQIIEENLNWFIQKDVQLLWQCGKFYFEKCKKSVEKLENNLIKIYDFITDMNYAYAIADIIVSRSGASTISELSIIGKLPIFIPSPNLAEDHQTKNAMALVNKNAALILKQNDIQKLLPMIEKYLFHDPTKKQMEQNLKSMALPNATSHIVDEMMKLIPKCNMSTLAHITQVFFIGIGGAGMSSLAQYFQAIGKSVGGYDRVKSENTNMLSDIGIEIFFEDDINFIPKDYTHKEHTLIIYTPAISKENNIFLYFSQNKFILKKRAEILGMISKETFCIAIAGTHGKTTTTAILAHIMKVANYPATSFLGGISQNYNSNLILGGKDTMVVEADEFDRSFLQLHPDICCITSMDADHLDIYHNHDELKRAFYLFSNKIKKRKNIIIRKGLPIKGQTYAVEEKADFYIDNILAKNGSYTFDIHTLDKHIQNIKMNSAGKHNLENTIAAVALAYKKNISLEIIRKALNSFQGVKRRFDYHIKTKNCIYIDDYAHHPKEIKSTILAIKEMHPHKRILGIFQPHLFSRTHEFADEFAQSLALLNELFLLEIYPARETPISGVNSNWLLKKIPLKHKKVIPKKDINKHIKNAHFDILLTLGAGDIGELVPTIKRNLI